MVEPVGRNYWELTIEERQDIEDWLMLFAIDAAEHSGATSTTGIPFQLPTIDAETTAAPDADTGEGGGGIRVEDAEARPRRTALQNTYSL